MSTAIILLILILICIYAIKSYTKKISHGCCGGSSEQPIKKKDVNSNDYKYIYKIKINGMNCNHCKIKIENSFNEISNNYMIINLKQNSGILYTNNNYEDKNIIDLITKDNYQVKEIIKIK